jgi:hypothetical protein
MKEGINHTEPANEEEPYKHTEKKLALTEQSASWDLYDT